MAKKYLVINEPNITSLEKVTDEILLSHKPDEENFDSELSFPESIENRIVHDPVSYIGKFEGMYFFHDVLRPILMGYVSFRKVANQEINEAITREELEWEVKMDNPQIIIVNGKPFSDMRSGYKSAIISELANMRRKIPYELLNRIFGSLEEELVKIYNEVYRNKGFVKGIVEAVYYTVAGVMDKPVTLISIKDKNGDLYRLGFNDYVNAMKVTGNAEVEFNNEVIACLTHDLHKISGDKTEVKTVKFSWYKIISYKIKN